jgi:hypothetical protein
MAKEGNAALRYCDHATASFPILINFERVWQILSGSGPAGRNKRNIWLDRAVIEDLIVKDSLFESDVVARMWPL